MSAMKRVVFATGNSEKLKDAQYVLDEYDIIVEQATLEIDEIQHHDPAAITKHKTLAAYRLLGKPVVVNDSSWSIPALGGFPGGYMKDVTAWLSTADFTALMRGHENKAIILKETTAYYDGHEYREFTDTRTGRFIDSPRGKSGPSFARLVCIEDDKLTIAEIFDQGARTLDSSRYGYWHAFAQRYSELPSSY